jgi:hypothetical protein
MKDPGADVVYNILGANTISKPIPIVLSMGLQEIAEMEGIVCGIV